jgi:hypothetical protein
MGAPTVPVIGGLVRGTAPPTDAISIHMTAELLDKLAQTFRVSFDDLASLL